MLPHYFNLDGGAASGHILVTESGVRLPDQPAKLLLISNLNVANNFASFSYDVGPVNNAPTQQAGGEVYWGIDGVFAHQIFPGEQTPILPVHNLKLITLRARPGSLRDIWYTWFW